MMYSIMSYVLLALLGVFLLIFPIFILFILIHAKWQELFNPINIKDDNDPLWFYEVKMEKTRTIF